MHCYTQILQVKSLTSYFISSCNFQELKEVWDKLKFIIESDIRWNTVFEKDINIVLLAYMKW